jgi:hypothetical protein
MTAWIDTWILMRSEGEANELERHNWVVDEVGQQVSSFLEASRNRKMRGFPAASHQENSRCMKM